VVRIPAASLAVDSLPLFCQTANLQGLITDESGAAVPTAAVTLKGPAGATISNQVLAREDQLVLPDESNVAELIDKTRRLLANETP
jgi:hypothetical protein